MSLGDYIFTDPQLKARQDVLAAQWNSLKAAYSVCDNTPDSSFSEFTTDYNNWTTFYKSGTDWSSDANNATNVWQATAKSWSDRLNQWGCNGTAALSPGSVGSDQPDPTGGIPGIKTPPPDTKSIIQQAKDALGNASQGLWSDISFIGYMILGVVVLIVFGLIYVLTHVKASAPGVGSIG